MTAGGVAGVRALVSGSIPPSAGLSSSSALVVSGALVTVWATGLNTDREQLASLCARSGQHGHNVCSKQK